MLQVGGAPTIKAASINRTTQGRLGEPLRPWPLISRVTATSMLSGPGEPINAVEPGPTATSCGSGESECDKVAMDRRGSQKCLACCWLCSNKGALDNPKARETRGHPSGRFVDRPGIERSTARWGRCGRLRGGVAAGQFGEIDRVQHQG